MFVSFPVESAREILLPPWALIANAGEMITGEDVCDPVFLPRGLAKKATPPLPGAIVLVGPKEEVSSLRSGVIVMDFSPSQEESAEEMSPLLSSVVGVSANSPDGSAVEASPLHLGVRTGALALQGSAEKMFLILLRVSVGASSKVGSTEEAYPL